MHFPPRIARCLGYDVRVLTEEVKARMRAAMQARDPVAKNILGLALGEIQTAEARANRALTDDEATAVVRKLVKSNEETLAHATQATDEARAAELRREIEVLTSLLPKALSLEAVVSALAPAADAVKAAKSDGQAMGVAMKHLKATGAVVESAAVQEAIRRLRSAP